MITYWSWLAVAGLGALHGLSPANGWMFAAACGVHARDAAQARRTLLPIACGHGAAIALVLMAVASGLLPNRALVQQVAGALLLVAAAYRGWRGVTPSQGARSRNVLTGLRAGQLAIALWAGLMATAHGAGLMLVPALLPLCMSDTPARAISASGSVLLALAAVILHLAVMLLTTAAIASGVCRGLASLGPRLAVVTLRQIWTAALAFTGALLLILH
jgi:hypothetical protein